MSTRAQHLAVIDRAVQPGSHSAYTLLHRLIVRRGLSCVLTDEAAHELALMIIFERRLHNRFAAESRAHYAKRDAVA